MNDLANLTDLERLIEATGALSVGSAPEGADALILADLARIRCARGLGAITVSVARDDGRAASL